MKSLSETVRELEVIVTRMDARQESILGKLDEFIRINESEHKIFFDRTRWGVTWRALGVTIGGMIAALAGLAAIFKGDQ